MIGCCAGFSIGMSTRFIVHFANDAGGVLVNQRGAGEPPRKDTTGGNEGGDENDEAEASGSADIAGGGKTETTAGADGPK